MFTGLVESLGTVKSVRDEPFGRRIAITGPAWISGLVVGESVAINGCCLTAVAVHGPFAEFQVGPETLRKTNLELLVPGQQVNLERSLAANARLGGHFVLGHVDATGTVVSRQRQDQWESFWFDAGGLTRLMVPQGSVAVDGISLTIVEVTANSFSVAVIPHTLMATTLGSKPVGATVNLEADVLGKYVFRYLQQSATGRPAANSIDADFMT